jgi:two-component system sensor histidine kinase VicK
MGVDIRVLIPAGEDELGRIMNELNLSALPHKIHIRSIGILVVDRTQSLIIESKDDTTDDYLQSVGLAAYSNSRPIATSYASIFESLWNHTELYEQLQVYNIMQEEFINIAAHELRTPIQPILGLSQMLRLKLKNSENIGFLDIIIRNANRLQRLTEDILDVQKIESRTLKLNKERFDLNDLILRVFDDHKLETKIKISNSFNSLQRKPNVG